MDPNQTNSAWEQFMQTGAIADYLQCRTGELQQLALLLDQDTPNQDTGGATPDATDRRRNRPAGL